MSNIGNKETMAKNLTYYVERSGKPKKEIAEALGVAPSTFNEWTKGKKYPRIDKIEMLANYFKILKSDLIEEKSLNTDSVKMTEFSRELVLDEETLELFKKLNSLDGTKKQLVKDLIYSLASAEV